MSKIVVPKDYKSKLNLYETQSAIGFIKRTFEDELMEKLNVKRVSAPLVVAASTGLNDDLSGVERPVSFSAKEDIHEIQIVHSLAKWKRMALSEYGFPKGEGIYTDMNAIRRDEDLDNTHSIYVDQWDWEIVISKKQRNIDYLKEIVIKIVEVIKNAEISIQKYYPILSKKIVNDVKFITTQELEDLYPKLTPKQREDAITKEFGTVFLLKIGDILKSGSKHDGRAPDYDDWELNGDLLLYNDVLNCAFELSSMGIRVSEESLALQLKKSNCEYRKDFPFHKLLLESKLPFTIGGGIGQSRLCMLLLEKAHIGEVQVSVWDSDTLEEAKKIWNSIIINILCHIAFKILNIMQYFYFLKYLLHKNLI